MSGCAGQLMNDIIDKVHEHNLIVHSLTGFTTTNNFSNKKTHLSGKGGHLTLHSCNRQQWDITDDTATKVLFENHDPDIYINGASIHSVDDIESDPSRAFEVNVVAPSRIAKLCNKHNTTFINISTNYVFGGQEKAGPYAEDSSMSPTNMYGIIKAAGETTVANECDSYTNIRVAGLFGKTGSRAKNNTNFPMVILDKLENDKELEVVVDQVMNVGYTVDIARALVKLLEKDISQLGTVYHLVNQGDLTWYDLAHFIVELKGYNPSKVLKAITSSKHYDGAKRAMYSAIVNTQTELLPTWQSAIVRFLKEIDEL